MMKKWYVGVVLSALIATGGLGVYAYAQTACPGGSGCHGQCPLPGNK